MNNVVAGKHFFDRRERFIKKGSPAAENVARLRHQYEAIVTRNRDLFRGARVLDLMSSHGFWSLAAIDAGASHVTGIDPSREAVEAAKQGFAEYPIDTKSYQFINSPVPKALRGLKPDAIDLVLCHGFLELVDPRFFFKQMARLRPKHIILDTRVVRGQGRIVRFALRSGEAPAGRYKNITTIPNHDLIAFLCDYFQFRLHQIDWQTMGITNWTGIADYESDRRRTYVLDRAATEQKK